MRQAILNASCSNSKKLSPYGTDGQLFTIDVCADFKVT